MSELSDGQRAALRGVCDTVVPALARDPDPEGFWGRSASDLGVPDGVEQLIAGLAPEMQDGLGQLLDALAGQGIARSPSQLSREQMLRNVSLARSRRRRRGGGAGRHDPLPHYGAPDPATGLNPNWAVFGFSGPLSAPPAVAQAARHCSSPTGTSSTLEADVCIVGSGAGGGVIAGDAGRARA